MGQEKRNGVHGADGATFEQSFRRLQEVVQTLSEGNLTLQDALASFEEGMKLADLCTAMLDNAELRLSQVSANAVRPNLQSVSGLEDALEGGSHMDENGGLVAIEMQSVESTLVFEVPRPAPFPASGLSPDGPRSAQQKKDTARPGNMEPEMELDPLFDEDD